MSPLRHQTIDISETFNQFISTMCGLYVFDQFQIVRSQFIQIPLKGTGCGLRFSIIQYLVYFYYSRCGWYANYRKHHPHIVDIYYHPHGRVVDYMYYHPCKRVVHQCTGHFSRLVEKAIIQSSTTRLHFNGNSVSVTS